jgi:hypothetical protein
VKFWNLVNSYFILGLLLKMIVDEESSTFVETDIGHLTDSLNDIIIRGGPRYEQILRSDLIIELQVIENLV